MAYLDYSKDFLQEVKKKAKLLIPNVISLKSEKKGSHFEDDTLDLPQSPLF